MDMHEEDDMDVVLALTTEQRIERAVQKLPTLAAHEVPTEDSCPICLVPFSTILEGEANGLQQVELAGVTKLYGCGHVFCRLDLIEWIRGRHGTCPACRHAFLDVKPISESDGESSDGDYIPGEDDFDEDEDLELTDEESVYSFEMDEDVPDPIDVIDMFEAEESIRWPSEELSAERAAFVDRVDSEGEARRSSEERRQEEGDANGPFNAESSKRRL